MPFSVIVRCGFTKPRLLPQLTRLYASSTNLCDSEAEEHLSGPSVAFRHGKVVIRLPNSTDCHSVFYAAPSDSLSALLKSIQSENEQFKAVSFGGESGEPLPDATTVGELIRSPFRVHVGGQAYKLAPPAYTGGAYGIDMHESCWDLRGLMQKGAFARLRRALHDSPAHHVTFAEFVNMCGQAGVHPAECDQLSKDLHRVGAILHFRDHPVLANFVFLHPDSIVDSLFAKFNLTSPKQAYIQKLIQAKQAELSAVETRIADKKATQTVIRNSAEKYAKRFNAMFGLGLTTGIGLYGYLSFVELNWDIMEPITYITGTGISLVGFWFWLATASEFEYSNMYGAVLGWKLRSAYRKLAEASPTAKPRSKREFIEIDGALHPVKVPHNADQVAFESELEALEAQAEKLRDELDDLSVQA